MAGAETWMGAGFLMPLSVRMSNLMRFMARSDATLQTSVEDVIDTWHLWRPPTDRALKAASRAGIDKRRRSSTSNSKGEAPPSPLSSRA